MDVMVTIRRQKIDDAYTMTVFARRQDFTKKAMSSKRRNTHTSSLCIESHSLSVCPVKIPVKRPRGGSLIECARVYFTE